MRQTAVEQSLVIARKELKEYFTSRYLMFAVFALPLLMAAGLPLFLGGLLAAVPTSVAPQVTKFLPAVLQQALLTMGPKQALYWYLFEVVILPVFLLLPVTSVIVLTSDSFAGEKERKTMEFLLSEPVSASVLLVGKTLAPVAVALASAWVSALVYWSLTYLITSATAVALAPSVSWYVALFVLVPLSTFANVFFVSWISSVARGFKEAQQLSGVLMLPIAGITISVATGSLLLSVNDELLISGAYLLIFVLGVLIWSKVMDPGRLIE